VRRRGGLGYRGSLEAATVIAPADRRAEVVSAYFVCGFTGNAVPVIGVGVIATIAVFAIVAFAFGLRYGH
jgi:hypothetical protein